MPLKLPEIEIGNKKNISPEQIRQKNKSQLLIKSPGINYLADNQRALDQNCKLKKFLFSPTRNATLTAVLGSPMNNE